MQFISASVLVALAAGLALAQDKVFKDSEGLIRARPPEVPADARSAAWPADLETAFWQRANNVISQFANAGGEGEKWSYPTAMLNYLAGNRQKGLAQLQAGDGDAADNAFTEGIDYYWCFTLKGQIRKYFYFADDLEPAYREKMKRGAKAWTAEDPRPMFELILSLESPDPMVGEYALKLLKQMKAKDDARLNKPPQDLGDDVAKWRAWWKAYADQGWQVFEEVERLINVRPHPVHGLGTGPVGTVWDAKVRGGVVDARCTDNLRAMREVAVYLMAEEAGNETVRRLYKDKIRRYVRALYTIGMGEWDSENYHGHTLAAYANLYDFARDGEVRLLGKAALDWLSAAGALKYYRGGFGGPTKRDYGGASRPFGSGIAHIMYLYFGDTPVVDPDPERDSVHCITSAYRPPMAVVGLGTRQFVKPVELLNTKPTYTNWTPGADEKPEFWETLFYGDTYYLGTCVSAGGSGDVGPFKLLAYNSKTGVDYFLANSGKKLNSKNGGDQVAQYRNLCIWLRAGDGKEFRFQIPGWATVEDAGGVKHIKLEKTWIALRPVNLVWPQSGQKDGKSGAMLWTAKQGGGAVAGFAVEIGDEKSHGTYEKFKQAIATASRLELGADQPKASLVGSDGRKLEMIYNKSSDLPGVVRDGKPRQWDKELDLYKPAEGDAPISLGWKQGTLRIEAAGQTFAQTVAEDGKVTFEVKP